LRTTMVRSLSVGFPITFALAVAGILANPSVWPCILPAGAAFLAACLAHARTRFRHAILPSLSFAAAAGLLALADRNSRLPAAAVALAAAIALLFAPRRPENPPG
jgi:hypothetical protein